MLSLISSYGSNALPISGLKKDGDLLNYDGPILSLFRDEDDRYYFFYWVDQDDSNNRWLVWKVRDENLYNYLNGQISLRDILLCEDKDYIFSVDIDDRLSYSNVMPIETKKIPEQYLPEVKSYYKLPLPQFAINFRDKYESSGNYYKVLMQQRSIIFNVSPTQLNFARAVTTQDAGSFLSKLTRSITGFIEENFFSKYKEIFNSATEYNRLLNQAKTLLAPRLYGLKYGSFEVLVGIDIVKKIEIKDFSEWQHSLLPKYEEDVVNVDYNNIHQIQNIVSKYSEPAREKIYDPYLKIINDPHYEVVVKDKSNQIVRMYSRVEKVKEDMVLPRKKENDQGLTTGKKFISMVIEVPEGQPITEINKKLLQSGLLFSQQLDELNFHLNSVEDGRVKIFFKAPLSYKFSYSNNLYAAYIEDLRLYTEHADKSLLIQNLQFEVVKLYEASRDLEDTEFIKTFFNEIVDHVERTS